MPTPAVLRTLAVLAVLLVATAPAVAAQGVTRVRPVDPTKPRDGLGFDIQLQIAAGVVSYPTIAAVLPGTPAEKAGLRVGDVLLAADGRDLVAEEVSLNPVAGTRMVLRIQRGSETLDVPLVSARLYTPPDSLLKARGTPRTP